MWGGGGGGGGGGGVVHGGPLWLTAYSAVLQNIQFEKAQC